AVAVVEVVPPVVPPEATVVEEVRIPDVAPWIAPPGHAAGRALPFGLGGEASAGPGAERPGVVPGHHDHRKIRSIEALAAGRIGGRVAAAGVDALAVARHGHLGPVDPEIAEEHLVRRVFDREHLLG